MGAQWTPVQVFGDDEAHHGACCSCCYGYCPMGDHTSEPSADMLYVVGEYLTDRFVAVRADLLAVPDSQPKMSPDISMPKSWTIPDAEPEPSTLRFLPSRATRLTALGIDIRQGDTAQHLYFKGDHIGYLMTASAGRTLDEIAALQRLEDRLLNSEIHARAREVMRDLGMENIDALMVLLDVGDELRAAVKS